MLKKVLIKTNLFIFLSFVLLIYNAHPATVMVFGVFDLLHPGHHSFFEQAKTKGDTLIIVVTRDAIVQQLKKRLPAQNERTRKEAVELLPGAHTVILGDTQLGDYCVIKEYKPDIICLGYDQQKFAQDLQRAMDSDEIPTIPLIFVEPYEPEHFHTSIIRAQLVQQDTSLPA